MKKTTMLTSCLALFILLSSCDSAEKKDESPVVVKSESAKTDMATVRTEIEAIEKEWSDAMNKKDVNALMALYTEDATSLQDGGPTLVGKAAMQAQMEKDFAAPARYASISFKTLDIYGSPEEVTEVGTSSEKDAAGKETGTGKYMAIFVKKDGKYKCIREIYNKDSK